nr:zinc finger, CCHC-type [Tanacetum cinerariifolium]
MYEEWGRRVTRHVGVSGIHQKNGLVEETNMTLIAKSPSSAIGFKTPIDMLWFFGWLASIKKCLNQVVLYKNMDFNKSGKYKKILIGFGGASLQEVQNQDLMDYQLACDREKHSSCELFKYREDNNETAFAVVDAEKIYVHESLTFNYTFACEVISKWKAGLKEVMDALSDAYVLNGMVFSCGCKAGIWVTQGLLDKAKGNVLGIEIFKDQIQNTQMVSQSRFYNKKLWSYACVVDSQGYHGVCTRPNIVSADVGMLDGFDRGLQTNVQGFVDFDYAMGRSITRYRFMIQRCAVIWEVKLQHMGVMLTTGATYMTLTKAVKDAIWLKVPSIKSGAELRSVVGIVTGALMKAVPGSSFVYANGCSLNDPDVPGFPNFQF